MKRADMDMNAEEYGKFVRKQHARIQKLKKPFDNLKTYAEKLKFWEENGLAWNISGYSILDFDSTDQEEWHKPENTLTLYTEIPDEIILHNKWQLKHVQELPENNLAKQKEICLEKMADNPQAKEYLEQKIESINTFLGKAKELNSKNALEQQPKYYGWFLGFQSVVTKDNSALSFSIRIFTSNAREYAKGLMDAHFLPFLENQLAILKTNKSKIQEIGMFDGNESKIQAHEYPLRQFIDMAPRYSIDRIHATVSERHPFSPLFEDYVMKSRERFEIFRIGLKNILLQTKPENWKPHEIDFKVRFLPMIESYLKWYNEHKLEFEKFGRYNPYEMMFEVAVSTKQELLMYFPEIEPQVELPQKKKSKNKTANASFKLKAGTIEKGTDTDILEILKKGKLISRQTKLSDFKKIFSGNDVINKIEWVGAIPALHAFIDEVWKFQEGGSGIWQTTINCFTHHKGLTETKLRNGRDVKPYDMDIIRKAVKFLTTP